jgi:hypothetical protein
LDIYRYNIHIILKFIYMDIKYHLDRIIFHKW